MFLVMLCSSSLNSTECSNITIENNLTGILILPMILIFISLILLVCFWEDLFFYYYLKDKESLESIPEPKKFKKWLRFHKINLMEEDL